MKLEETYDRYSCDECDTYDYLFTITIGDCAETSRETSLCKSCLLKLLKLIIER